MSDLSQNNSSVKSTQFKDWQLFVPFALIVLLQVIGTFVNNNSVWGINLWSVFPAWVVVVAASVYVALSVPSISLIGYSLVGVAVTQVRKTV